MKEKKDTGKTEKTAKKTDKPSRCHEFHGARMSKVDPQMQTILQHEQHKMRIVKITFLMVFVCVAIFVSYGLYDYFVKHSARKAHTEQVLASLDAMEKDMASQRLSPYAKHQIAVKAIRTAEVLASRDPEVKAETDRRIKEYNAKLHNSFPVLHAPNVKSDGFICRSAMLDMVHIPAGKFTMGRSTDSKETGEASETPAHEVTIRDQFWIARTEVTVWQIRKLIPGFRTEEWSGYALDGLNQPACGITWEQAMLFCIKLTELERMEGRIPEKYEYRLPTEAEWEYACRAGTNATFYWEGAFGANGAKYANSLDKAAADAFGLRVNKFDDAAPKDGYFVSSPVAKFQPNAWGLYDMAGNLSEWCYDWYDPTIYKPGRIKPVSPVMSIPVNVAYTRNRPYDSGTYDSETACRVLRGGSWGNLPARLRCAARDFMPPNEVNNGVGFRPVLAPAIPSKMRN